MYNVGPADDPAHVYVAGRYGTLDASTELDATPVYRTGGATVEGGTVSWLISTTSTCTERTPFVTPWIYGTVDSTGSKRFTLYIQNTIADFTDAEIWLEVEYLSASDEADS